MPDNNVSKISTWADQWGKIATLAVGAIIFIYQSSTVINMAKDTAVDLDNFKKQVDKDNAFRDDRAEKRYQRALDMYGELKAQGIKLQDELHKYQMQDQYNQGRTDATLEFLKHKNQ